MITKDHSIATGAAAVSGETWLVEAISRCIVEHCGVDDSEFIAAVENGTGVVMANADPVAQAILEMPEMLLVRDLLSLMSRTSGISELVVGNLAKFPSLLAWIEN